MSPTEAENQVVPAEATAKPSGAARSIAFATRWILIVHAALLVAQPFIAGSLLDGMSPVAQAWHLNIGMFLASFGFVQVIATALAWKVAGWPQNAFAGSIAIWVLEVAQFFIGYLGMSLAMHIPLGVVLVIGGLLMAYLYARRSLPPAE